MAEPLVGAEDTNDASQGLHAGISSQDLYVDILSVAGQDRGKGILPVLGNSPVLRGRDDSAPRTSRAACDGGELKVVWIWGLPLARLGRQETVELVDLLIERGEPTFFITANLHYAMLADRDPRLAEVNQKAAFLVADGMPMIWYSWLIRRPLPERVAGSDLIFLLCQRAAERAHRVFFLGGRPGVAALAAARLAAMYPGLEVAGVEAPELEALSARAHEELVNSIRESRPDLLLVAFGQPKGEFWLAENCEALGVPVCVQVGASFDFVAGRVARAPGWMQRTGLEWLYRMAREPRRMAPRYARDAAFLAKAVLRDLLSAPRRPRAASSASRS